MALQDGMRRRELIFLHSASADAAVDQEALAVDRIACAELQDLRIAAHHPKRRMGALEWPR